ncbi:MAG: 16S rRNA processing protein RimM [Chloroflexi bacterium]|nr:16S rRNA processing protein RimM [Chloroflexota bacterium]
MADVKLPGSPVGEPEYLVIGFLRRPFGVSGEILMDLHTDFPERFRTGRKIYVGDEHKPMTLASVRPHGENMLVRLRGVNTPEMAGQYRNTWIFIKTKDAPPLPEGQYYQYQLLGLKVVDEEDHPLGTLTEILETGANDVYVVKDEAGKETLLPAIPSVILDVQPEAGVIRVHLLEGL